MKTFLSIKHLQVTIPLLLLQSSMVTCLAQASTMAPAHISEEIPQAQLQGSGSYRWFGLHIYDAALWSTSGAYQPDRDKTTRIALDLTYARTLYGNKIASASIEEIEKLQLGTAEKRERWLAQMKTLFPDVRQGTHITGIYVPNEAARFYLNGKLLGEIRDAEFANAFFAIWLDKKTSAQNLRNKLLGSTGN
ncbi:chalcone isomerase family protein [Undibacterium sp. TS12]|uniref:chalcone isomerase family protein n=1 Tax=Undibacterium sp. TS12 TaxID=2908202 RepID=UPI001F4D17A7|nr:chalcone isomerase family protein [Undibacterium sp. TS12]MCH8621322.1 chalcone isomerase family protein [Undibacterium sp. TS12]